MFIVPCDLVTILGQTSSLLCGWFIMNKVGIVWVWNTNIASFQSFFFFKSYLELLNNMWLESRSTTENWTFIMFRIVMVRFHLYCDFSFLRFNFCSACINLNG